MILTVYVVYLRCDLIECKKRIHVRALAQLRKIYERWNTSLVLVFDAKLKIGFIVLIISWCLCHICILFPRFLFFTPLDI